MYILKYYECRDFRFYSGGVKSQRIKERPKRKKGEEQKNRGQRTEGEIKDQNYIFNLFKNIKYMSKKLFLVRRTSRTKIKNELKKNIRVRRRIIKKKHLFFLSFYIMILVFS